MNTATKIIHKVLFKPHDREPDGNIYLPHHYWIGLFLLIGGWFLWGTSPTGRIVTVVGLYVVADDVLEHSFGWPMPLDWSFKWAMKNTRLRRWYRKYVLRWYG